MYTMIKPIPYHKGLNIDCLNILNSLVVTVWFYHYNNTVQFRSTIHSNIQRNEQLLVSAGFVKRFAGGGCHRSPSLKRSPGVSHPENVWKSILNYSFWCIFALFSDSLCSPVFQQYFWISDRFRPTLWQMWQNVRNTCAAAHWLSKVNEYCITSSENVLDCRMICLTCLSNA